MRDIIFRGKRSNDGKWIYGSYVYQYGANMIYLPDGTDQECGFDYYHIVPETVGQYTGLTDKNGKKIFEGDILKGKHNWRSWNYSSDNTEEEFFAQKIRGAYGKHKSEEYALFDEDRYFYYRNYAVEYYAKNGGYRVRNGGQFHSLTQSYIYNRDLEVIGNIHDNPELLKGGEAE